MWTNNRWTAAAFLAFLVAASPTQAQFYNQGYGMNPGGYGMNAYNLPDPYAGNLYGSSSVINSLGQYQLTTQQSYAMQEQLKRSKIDTKRKNFDEWMYEQAHTPSLEDNRTKEQHEQLRRSRNDPPLTEIWSGKALNDLYLDLQKLQGSNAYAPSMQLEPDMLRHINMGTGQHDGSVGLFREGGKLTWPLTLTEAKYDRERKKIDQLVPTLTAQGEAGKIDMVTVRDLMGSTGRLMAQLKDNVADIPTNEYILAKRYLQQLTDSTKVLQDPNAKNFFNKKWTAQGNTVGELVSYMTNNGLRFARATSGDEPYYTALHRKMADYDIALTQMAGHGSDAQVRSGNSPPPPGNRR